MTAKGRVGLKSIGTALVELWMGASNREEAVILLDDRRSGTGQRASVGLVDRNKGNMKGETTLFELRNGNLPFYSRGKRGWRLAPGDECANIINLVAPPGQS